MFEFRGVAGGSIFWCQFRGPDYNAPGQPGIANWSVGQTAIHSAGNASSYTSGQVFAGNDFNGISGTAEAVDLYMGNDFQSTPSNITIEYNTFEHCGTNDAYMGAGTN
jgi:hypothetical protein